MKKPMLIISCHADTGFRSHRLAKLGGGVLLGHLDNFVGVHAVMKAFFSGGLDRDRVRIELTHGEECDMAGAVEVARSLSPEDVVLVVDVTGAPTDKDFVIEKCTEPRLQRFLRTSLKGLRYDLYDFSPDPISDVDETEVYAQKCAHVCFVGLPCWGGDYNRVAVRCRQASINAVAKALCRVAANFDKWR